MQMTWFSFIKIILLNSKIFLVLYFKLILSIQRHLPMDYKKKSLNKLNKKESYEEIDSRLASGWYVDTSSGARQKKYKTKEVVFKIARKSQ